MHLLPRKLIILPVFLWEITNGSDESTSPAEPTSVRPPFVKLGRTLTKGQRTVFQSPGGRTYVETLMQAAPDIVEQYSRLGKLVDGKNRADGKSFTLQWQTLIYSDDKGDHPTLFQLQDDPKEGRYYKWTDGKDCTPIPNEPGVYRYVKKNTKEDRLEVDYIGETKHIRTRHMQHATRKDQKVERELCKDRSHKDQFDKTGKIEKISDKWYFEWMTLKSFKEQYEDFLDTFYKENQPKDTSTEIWLAKLEEQKAKIMDEHFDQKYLESYCIWVQMMINCKEKGVKIINSMPCLNVKNDWRKYAMQMVEARELLNARDRRTIATKGHHRKHRDPAMMPVWYWKLFDGDYEVCQIKSSLTDDYKKEVDVARWTTDALKLRCESRKPTVPEIRESGQPSPNPKNPSDAEPKKRPAEEVSSDDPSKRQLLDSKRRRLNQRLCEAA